jgi:hypothetical protein
VPEWGSRTSTGAFVGTGQRPLEADDQAAAVAAARAAEESIGPGRSAAHLGRPGARSSRAPARIDAALTSISADAERLAANDQLTTTALPAAREAITQGTAARDQRVALARWRGRLGAPKSREKPR